LWISVAQGKAARTQALDQYVDSFVAKPNSASARVRKNNGTGWRRKLLTPRTDESTSRARAQVSITAMSVFGPHVLVW
jgi:hypothetical protein